LIKTPDVFKEKGCQTLESGDRSMADSPSKQSSKIETALTKTLTSKFKKIAKIKEEEKEVDKKIKV